MRRGPVVGVAGSARNHPPSQARAPARPIHAPSAQTRRPADALGGLRRGPRPASARRRSLRLGVVRVQRRAGLVTGRSKINMQGDVSRERSELTMTDVTRAGGPPGAGGSAGRDPEVLPRLRDERDRRAGAAGCARRAEAGAPADPVRDVRRRLPARPRLEQVRPRRRRGDGSVPPARRRRDLRHPGTAGAAVGDALSAGRRAGQLRLAGQRQGRGHALHRVPDGAAGHGDGPRHQREHGRLQAELRRQGAGAGRPAGPVPEPAGQRLDRHRGRHGHQHPDPQPARGRLRGAVVAGASRGDAPRSCSRRPWSGSRAPTSPTAR